MGELLEDGIVLEVGTSPSTGGRRPIMIRLGGERHLAIGVALEDDLCLVTAVTLDGATLESSATPLPYGSSPESAIEVIARQTDILFTKYPDVSFFGCGLAMAAFVDPVSDEITSSGFGWKGVPFRQLLEQRIGLPTAIIDNVQAAALGELWLRGRESRESLAYIYAGRGAGGAIVLDRQIYFGRHNVAGSIGSMLVANGEPIDEPFGGFFENLTDPAYLKSWMLEHRHEHPESELPIDIAERDFLQTVAGAAARNDSLAVAIIARAALVVGAACANLINVFNPDEVILGGPMSLWGEHFASMVLATAKSWSLPAAMNNTAILIAQSRHLTIPLGAGATIIQRASELLAHR